MRNYTDLAKMQLCEVICNHCGKHMKVENGILKEGCMTYRDMFGYFSKKDGEQHSFDLCEDCYDKWIQSFRIPVTIEEKELL